MLKTNLEDIGNVPFRLPTTVSPHNRTGPNFLPLNTRMQKLHEVHPRWKVWRVFFSLIRLHFARGQKCCPRYLCRAVCSKFASNKTKQQQTKKRSGNPRNVVTSGWRHGFFFLERPGPVAVSRWRMNTQRNTWSGPLPLWRVTWGWRCAPPRSLAAGWPVLWWTAARQGSPSA